MFICLFFLFFCLLLLPREQESFLRLIALSNISKAAIKKKTERRAERGSSIDGFKAAYYRGYEQIFIIRDAERLVREKQVPLEQGFHDRNAKGAKAGFSLRIRLSDAAIRRRPRGRERLRKRSVILTTNRKGQKDRPLRGGLFEKIRTFLRIGEFLRIFLHFCTAFPKNFRQFMHNFHMFIIQ